MLMTPQSGTLTFRPRARLLKLIGAELISDEVVALTELVKNAYDADASQVQIEFLDVRGDGGEIIVQDNGHGMSLEALMSFWMEPAGTSKSGTEQKHSVRGRRVLGEKGVGRFAVDKLARRLELVSRVEGSDQEVVAHFDWDAFDSDDHMLADIENEWHLRPAREIESHGTILRLRGLRAGWNERMFRRLCTRLGRLQSPFDPHDGFVIRIDSDEFPDYAGELRGGFLDKAPYSFDASFDGEETLRVTINGEAARVFFYRQSELTCGPVRIHLGAFDLETESLAKLGPRMEVRAWLKEWSGVSIYRDGFRLWPYGEPHDDWLRLDQRRVNNPVLRLSNNQIVGFVEIGSDANPELRDQTNREGLINNQAFTDLRLLMYYVLQILENYRQERRHPSIPRRSTPANLVEPEKSSDAVAVDLEKLSRKVKPELAKELTRLGRRVREDQARESARLRQLHEAYAELAAFGHTATTFTEEIKGLLAQMQQQQKELVRMLGRHSSRDVDDRLDCLGKSTQKVVSYLERLMPQPETSSGRRRAIDVMKELEAANEHLRPLLASAGVDRIELEAEHGGLIRTEMRPENFHRIIQILTENALDWSDAARGIRLKVSLHKHNDVCEIVYSDNGSGIPEEIVEKVFEPGFSWKENGRGMGLAIAQSLVELHGGSIGVLRDGRRRGADIRIVLPLKRARSTVS